jgi:hypothetical protein
LPIQTHFAWKLFARSYRRIRAVVISCFRNKTHYKRGNTVNRKDLVGMLRRISWTSWVMVSLFAGAAFAQNAENPEIPVVDGHLGSCSTTITVLDNESKPVYNAKVTVDIQYGFLGFRTMSLEVGTNSDGKARVAGLPVKPKYPLKFVVTSKRLSKKVLVDTAAKCNDSIQVNLGAQ